jgi:hypothetical protein
MNGRTVLVLALALLAPWAASFARAETAPEGAAVAPNTAPPPSSSAHPLRKHRPDATEIEVVTIGEDTPPDRQRRAFGIALGGAWMTNKGSNGAGSANLALSFSFGLGPGGARVPLTLEPYLGYAVTYGTGFGTGVHPNRFTELGIKLVWRFSDELGPRWFAWLSTGGGAVWTSTRPNPDRPKGNIAPGAVVDLGVGVYEWTGRRSRLGVAVRSPIQLSSNPGFAVMGLLYAQLAF